MAAFYSDGTHARTCRAAGSIKAAYTAPTQALQSVPASPSNFVFLLPCAIDHPPEAMLQPSPISVLSYSRGCPPSGCCSLSASVVSAPSDAAAAVQRGCFLLALIAALWRSPASWLLMVLLCSGCWWKGGASAASLLLEAWAVWLVAPAPFL